MHACAMLGLKHWSLEKATIFLIGIFVNLAEVISFPPLIAFTVGGYSLFWLIPEFPNDVNFLCSPYVEYKGVIPSKDLENKRGALESEVNRLVTLGGQVYLASKLQTYWALVAWVGLHGACSASALF